MLPGAARSVQKASPALSGPCGLSRLWGQELWAPFTPHLPFSDYLFCAGIFYSCLTFCELHVSSFYLCYKCLKVVIEPGVLESILDLNSWKGLLSLGFTLLLRELAWEIKGVPRGYPGCRARLLYRWTIVNIGLHCKHRWCLASILCLTKLLSSCNWEKLILN